MLLLLIITSSNNAQVTHGVTLHKVTTTDYDHKIIQQDEISPNRTIPVTEFLTITIDGDIIHASPRGIKMYAITRSHYGNSTHEAEYRNIIYLSDEGEKSNFLFEYDKCTLTIIFKYDGRISTYEYYMNSVYAKYKEDFIFCTTFKSVSNDMFLNNK